ncbi:DEAD/DEAH box helicase [Bacillus paranthracis]|uniref:DEAD/DEAH box helicase n=1 Tax=Bacillus paranthracis TaxID=2026186 RepID=UPI002DD41DFE|nr:DEAD/DEAH box helicase [Bacillus paranthracis]MEC4620134.1 DEAD/DEAH box helicase [Bacillus paranthracis]
MINLKINSLKESYLLVGDGVNKLNRRIVFHLKRVFNAIETVEGLEIPKNNDNVISELSDYLSKKQINLLLDGDADNTLNNLYNEEMIFKEFSNTAKEIWNRNVDKDEFQKFCEVLNVNLVRTLYPLQLLAAYHLAFSQNACNFSVPGAGKTSIVYGAYSYLNSLDIKHQKFVNKVLVIGPLSSFGPWETEFKDCFGRVPEVKRLSGGNLSNELKKRYFFGRDTAELTLISYQGIINQKKNLEFFLRNNDVMIVLDEAHKIKNTDGGSIAETILELAPLAKGRVVLTGTPAPNGYRDLYNLFKFIWPSKSLINYSLNQLDDMTGNPRDPRIQLLIDDISPYFVRIKKKDLGLPDKIENPPIIVPMDSTQKLIYETLEQKTIKDLTDDEEGLVDGLKKAKIIRLMQAASNPYLLLKPIQEGISNVDYSSKTFDEELVNTLINYKRTNSIPPKFDVALNLIKDLIRKNEKVIVWAIYIDTVERFSDYLLENGIGCKILYGKTKVESEGLDETVETREKIIREFHNNESEFKVIIANPFAVAESISLHKACHNAIYLERNFDGARYIQSKDRIHRYGLDVNTITNYYYLITENSIDEVIDERLIEKENLMIRVTENSDIPLFQILDEEIDKNDIKALINNYVNKNR